MFVTSAFTSVYYFHFHYGIKRQNKRKQVCMAMATKNETVGNRFIQVQQQITLKLSQTIQVEIPTKDNSKFQRILNCCCYCHNIYTTGNRTRLPFLNRNRHVRTSQVAELSEPKKTCLEARTCLENENPCLEKSGPVLQFFPAYLCSFT